MTTSFSAEGPDDSAAYVAALWLETPFDVFDKSVFTPNDQHYVSWHWATYPDEIKVDHYSLAVRGEVNQTLSLSLKDIRRACRNSKSSL